MTALQESVVESDSNHAAHLLGSSPAAGHVYRVRAGHEPKALVCMDRMTRRVKSVIGLESGDRGGLGYVRRPFDASITRP